MVRRSLIAAALLVVASPLAAQDEWVWTSDRPDGNAPIGVLGARTMAASELEVSYRFSQMNSMGVWFGSDSLGLAGTLLSYPDAPLTLTDQGHQLSFAFGVSDALTILARGSFHHFQRETWDGGMNAIVRTNVNAIGDAEVGALYNLYREGPYRLDVQLGGALPVGKTRTRATINGVSTPLPYDMRPGAGAFAVVAGISGSVQNEVASVGGQFKLWAPVADLGTYQRGRSFESNGWVAYAFNTHISVSGGLRWQTWDHLNTLDPLLAPVIDDDPGNAGSTIGGQRAMLPIGFNFRIPEGSALAGHRLSLEAVYAIHHDYEGPQLGLDWGVNLGWAFGL